MPFPTPDGTIGHAEVKIEGATVALSDEWPGVGARSPSQIGGTTIGIYVHVKDVDDAFTRRAVAAGAEVLRPVADQFYGERSVTLQDSFGHVWYFATVKEKLTVEEMMRRMPKQPGVMAPGRSPPLPGLSGARYTPVTRGDRWRWK
jgi:PhnB protein